MSSYFRDSTLERLKTEGSVTSEQYASMKASYYQNMTAAVSEIASIKSQLKLQLQATEQNLNALRTELEGLGIKHKVGELTLEKYHSSQQKLMKTIGATENTMGELQRLITAKSSAHIGISSKESDVGLQSLKIPISSISTMSTNEAFSKSGIVSLIIAGVMLISVFLPWVSLWLVEASAIQTHVALGLVCIIVSLAYAGATFLQDKQARGKAHVGVGVAAAAVPAIFLFLVWLEMKKPGVSLFRLLGAGFWLYAVAAVAGIITGSWETKG